MTLMFCFVVVFLINFINGNSCYWFHMATILKWWSHVMSCWRFVRNHARKWSIHDPTPTSSNRAGALGVEHSRHWCESCPQLLRRHVCLCPENHPVWHTWGCSPSNVFFELVVVTNYTRFGFFPLWKCQCGNVVAVPLCSVCCILQWGRKGVEGRVTRRPRWVDDRLLCHLTAEWHFNLYVN